MVDVRRTEPGRRGGAGSTGSWGPETVGSLMITGSNTTAPARRHRLTARLGGDAHEAEVDAPIYFMTENQISRGISQRALFSGQHYEIVTAPDRVESVLARLATGDGDALELWKCSQYHDRLDDWDRAHGLPETPFAPPPAEPQLELYNLTEDPEERTNLAAADGDALAQMQTQLDSTRDRMRRLPTHRNR